MRYIIFFIMTSILFPAGFDCSKARTNVEHRICSNYKISLLDDTMSFLYNHIINNTMKNYDLDKGEFIKRQKEWLEYSRNICNTDTCLIRSYISRINEMIFNLIDPNPNIENDVTYMGYCNMRRSFTYNECIDKSGGVTTSMKQCISEDGKDVRKYIDYLESRIKRMLKYAIKEGIYKKKSYERFLKMIEAHKMYQEGRCNLFIQPVPGTMDILESDDCYLEEDYRWLYELKKINETIEDNLN